MRKVLGRALRNDTIYYVMSFRQSILARVAFFGNSFSFEYASIRNMDVLVSCVCLIAQSCNRRSS